MCGIAGFIDQTTPRAEEPLQRMLDRIAHQVAQHGQERVAVQGQYMARADLIVEAQSRLPGLGFTLRKDVFERFKYVPGPSSDW